MVDFSKPLPIREKDYLAYLIDKCDLNSWCKSAFPGMLAWLRGGEGRSLSPKQRASLDRAIKDYDLGKHIKDGFLVRGYADRTDAQVVAKVGPGTVSSKMAQAGDDTLDDLPDDDIPF